MGRNSSPSTASPNSARRQATSVSFEMVLGGSRMDPGQIHLTDGSGTRGVTSAPVADWQETLERVFDALLPDGNSDWRASVAARAIARLKAQPDLADNLNT